MLVYWTKFLVLASILLSIACFRTPVLRRHPFGSHLFAQVSRGRNSPKKAEEAKPRRQISKADEEFLATCKVSNRVRRTIYRTSAASQPSARPVQGTSRSAITSTPSTSSSAARGASSTSATSATTSASSSATSSTTSSSSANNFFTQSPNNLRILGGLAHGKKINSPTVFLRPMMAKVRSALFSTLTSLGLFSTPGTCILDMFSGAGSVGLEALSRGAAHATFVDLSPICVSTCLDNAKKLGFGKVSSVCGRAEEVLLDPKHPQQYHIVSLTPPYQEISYTELLHAVCRSPLLAPNSIVVVEYPVEMGTMPFTIGLSTTFKDTRLLKISGFQGDNVRKARAGGVAVTTSPSAAASTAASGASNDAVLFGLRNRRYGRTVLATYVFKPNRLFDLRPLEFEKLA